MFDFASKSELFIELNQTNFSDSPLLLLTSWLYVNYLFLWYYWFM